MVLYLCHHNEVSVQLSHEYLHTLSPLTSLVSALWVLYIHYICVGIFQVDLPLGRDNRHVPPARHRQAPCTSRSPETSAMHLPLARDKRHVPPARPRQAPCTSSSPDREAQCTTSSPDREAPCTSSSPDREAPCICCLLFDLGTY